MTMARARTTAHRGVHVQIDARHFIVEYDEAGVVLRIKERKPHPQNDVSYFSPKHHQLGAGNTLPKRIIAAADATTS